ncbi:MAG: hypothetical protein ACPG80_02675, partial [Rickettsiales bacterium]
MRGKMPKAPFIVSLLISVICWMLLAMMAQAHAYTTDKALEDGGYRCTKQVARNERRYGIPSRLLGAMAATESGRRHSGLGVNIPWPWT